MGGASNFHPLKFRIFHEIYQPSSDWLWKPLEPQQKFTASRDLLIVCPRRRLRDNACQLRAEILRYEGAMVTPTKQIDIGAFVGFPYVMWVPLKMVGL